MNRKTKTIIGFAAIGSIWYAATIFDVKDMHHRFNSIFRNGSISERATDDKKTLPQPDNLLEKIVKKEERYVSGSTSSYAGLNATGEAVENYTIERGPKPKNYYANKLDDILKGFDSNYPDFEGLAKLLEESARDMKVFPPIKREFGSEGKASIPGQSLNFRYVLYNNGNVEIELMNDNSHDFGGFNINILYVSKNPELLVDIINLNLKRSGDSFPISGEIPLQIFMPEQYRLTINNQGYFLTYNPAKGLRHDGPGSGFFRGFGLLPFNIQQNLNIHTN